MKKKSEVENAGEVWMAFAALSFYIGAAFFIVCKWIFGLQLPYLVWLSMIIGITLGFAGSRIQFIRDVVNGLTDLFRYFN